MRCEFHRCLLALLLGLAGCSDPRHGTATLVELGEHTWHAEWADHGKHLVVISGLQRNPIGEKPWHWDYRLERVTIHPPATWEIAGEIRSAEHMTDAFSCGDENVVAVVEGSRETSYGIFLHNISFYRFDTGERIKRHTIYGYYNRPSSSREWFPYTYACDVAANVMYMRWADNKVVALDGSSGEILREFVKVLAPGEQGGPGFFIQPELDRLVWLERGIGNSEVRTFRLSTGELLGAVCLTCGTQKIVSDYLVSGPDHVVGITVSLPGFCEGHQASTAIAVVNLETLEVERRFCLPDRVSGGAVVIPGEPTYLMVYVRKMPQDCWEVRTIDLATGMERPPVDLCEYSASAFAPYPEVARILKTNLRPSSGESGPLWWLLTWPDYEVVAEGVMDHYYDKGALAPERGLFVLQSEYVNSFAAFDIIHGGIVDEFPWCRGVHEAALRLDPTKRWATTRCFGDWTGVTTQTQKPKGAGFAVVDLAQYEDW
jgi:hypothetical protein